MAAKEIIFDIAARELIANGLSVARASLARRDRVVHLRPAA